MKLQITGAQGSVLSGLFVHYMTVVAVRSSVLPLFYPFLLMEFGWDSTQVTAAATLGYFMSAGLSAVVAPLFDKLPVRNLMLVGILLICGGLFLYAGISSIPYMMAIYAMLALGQACCGQVPVMVLTTRWFTRHRGMAIGTVMTATSVGGAIFPLLVRPLLADGDWRATAMQLALMNGVLLLLPWMFLIRNKPAPALQPAASTTVGDKGNAATPLRPLALIEFSLLALVTGGIWFIVNGMLQHQSIMMSRELQIPLATIPLVVSVYFWSAIVGKLLSGYIGDRVDKRLTLLVGVVSLIIGLLILRAFGAGAIYIYAIFFGFGFGSTASLMQMLIAEYYAGANYGKVLGLLTMIDIGAGGLGIPSMAFLERYYGSYMPVLELLLVLCGVVVAGILYLGYLGRGLTHSGGGQHNPGY